MESRYLRQLAKVGGGVGTILTAMMTVGQNKELLAHLRDYPVLRLFPDNQGLFMIFTLLLGAEVYSLLLIHLTGPWDLGRKRGLYSLCVLFLVPAALWSSQLWTYSDSEALSKELLAHSWVGYDPLDFHPIFRPSPAVETMRRDLRWIRQAGFTGVVTFASTGSLQEIPTIARDEGLAVIMGVWNPNDRGELVAAARKKESVLGYTVGHDRLGSGYSLTELTVAVQYLRDATSRPVTTTEFVKDYDDPGEPRLAPVSDWLFPDVHLSLRDAGGVLSEERIPRYVQEILDGVRKAELLARRLHRPLMLKMLTFPRAGVPGASPDLQRAFFRCMIEPFHDAYSGLRERAAFMVHSAFDAPWKIGSPYNSWDPYTGFVSNQGAAFPAGAEVTQRWQ